MPINKTTRKPSNLPNAPVERVKMNQAKKLSKQQISNFQNKVKNMDKKLESGAYELGQKARNAVDKTENLINDSVDYVETKAKERPFITIGVSLLIGMLLARLTSNHK